MNLKMYIKSHKNNSTKIQFDLDVLSLIVVFLTGLYSIILISLI